MKKLLVNLLRLTISVIILAVVVWQAMRDPQFVQNLSQLNERLLDSWPLMMAAWAAIFVALLLTIIRWHLLVIALGLPFRFRDALRLGFLGYLFNFVSLGSVGGDLFKAIFLAREHPGRRAEAVATVIVDRMIGLYALFVVAAVAIVANDMVWIEEPVAVRVIVRATLIATLAGAVGGVLLMLPGFTTGPISELLIRLPRVGATIEALMRAIRVYRRRLPLLSVTFLLSLGVHVLCVLGCWLISYSLPGVIPTLGQQFLIIPLAMVAGALPLPLGALGAFEAAMEYFFVALAPGVNVADGQGLMVAVGYRVLTIVNAFIGVGIYLSSRREFDRIISVAEREGESLLELETDPRLELDGPLSEEGSPG